jgi:hypothetical protein
MYANSISGPWSPVQDSNLYATHAAVGFKPTVFACFTNRGCLVAKEGVEPSVPDYEPSVLPLHYLAVVSGEVWYSPVSALASERIASTTTFGGECRN